MVDFTDRIKPNDAALTTYVDDLLRRKYQIPTFQRDVVWDENQVKRLWDSIFRFYPIGSILIWKTEIKLHNHREIGGFPIKAEFHHNRIPIPLRRTATYYRSADSTSWRKDL